MADGTGGGSGGVPVGGVPNDRDAVRTRASESLRIADDSSETEL